MNLTFAGGTVSDVMCPADIQKKDNKMARRETSHEGGINKDPKRVVGRNKTVGSR